MSIFQGPMLSNIITVLTVVPWCLFVRFIVKHMNSVREDIGLSRNALYFAIAIPGCVLIVLIRILVF